MNVCPSNFFVLPSLLRSFPSFSFFPHTNKPSLKVWHAGAKNNCQWLKDRLTNPDELTNWMMADRKWHIHSYKYMKNDKKRFEQEKEIRFLEWESLERRKTQRRVTPKFTRINERIRKRKGISRHVIAVTWLRKQRIRLF